LDMFTKELLVIATAARELEHFHSIVTGMVMSIFTPQMPRKLAQQHLEQLANLVISMKDQLVMSNRKNASIYSALQRNYFL
jgi:hypothetical protein